MAKSELKNQLGEYNYKAFTQSESASKAGEFKNSIRAGEEAPDFELATLEGERIRLSQSKTRAVGIRQHYLTALCRRGLAAQSTLQRVQGPRI